MAINTAIVFPGQGSQTVGLIESAPSNDDLERLLDAAEALAGVPLRVVASQGPQETLSQTQYSQPLLYLADWAWGVAVLEAGVEPQAVAGHSLGELAALTVAGVFSVEAGLELVVERSRLMATAAAENPGTMAAVLGMEGSEIAEVVSTIDGVWMANDNAPGQVVISGVADAVSEASGALLEAGARRVVPLDVAGAFHSPLMSTAADQFADILRATDFHDPWLPVYQNTDPTPSSDAQTIRQRLIAQIPQPVQWTATMRNMAADGVELLIEAGPGAVLAGLAKRVEGLKALSAQSVGLSRVIEEVQA